MPRKKEGLSKVGSEQASNEEIKNILKMRDSILGLKKAKAAR